jgi:drug/metabolite transporter (DMT)-like permease
MPKLISIGLLSGLFFSTTFILNRLMSLEGGHWVWSGSLRYGYMILLLAAGVPVFQGPRAAAALIRLLVRHWWFWLLAGSIGFGGFYSLICYSADNAPGWVVATTWQMTIIASLFVLMAFGRRFPKKIWAFSVMVFAGVAMVNFSQASAATTREVLMGSLPVLVAAFCYPIGNQMVWEATHGHRLLPDIRDPCLDNPFNKVLLMSVGSLPFWGLLVALAAPAPPSGGQLVHTALVAVFSGVVATSLFLAARNRSRRASELAAVDATQSSEVIFAMAGEVLLLGAPLPDAAAVAGMAMVFGGLGLFIRYQEPTAAAGEATVPMTDAG